MSSCPLLQSHAYEATDRRDQSAHVVLSRIEHVRVARTSPTTTRHRSTERPATGTEERSQPRVGPRPARCRTRLRNMLTPITPAISPNVCSWLSLNRRAVASLAGVITAGRPPTLPAAQGSRHSSPRAFDDNFPFELRQRRKDVENKAAGRLVDHENLLRQFGGKPTASLVGSETSRGAIAPASAEKRKTRWPVPPVRCWSTPRLDVSIPGEAGPAAQQAESKGVDNEAAISKGPLVTTMMLVGEAQNPGTQSTAHPPTAGGVLVRSNT